MVDVLTVFFIPIIGLFVAVIFVGIFIWSTVYLIKNYKTKKLSAGYSLLINIITILIVIFVPFTEIRTQMDFKVHYNAREEIITMIQTGKLVKNTDYSILLPEGYRNLSKGGGEIIIYEDNENIEILFYTFRGILDNFAGFVYTTTGNEPHMEQYKIVVHMKENWYWCSSW